MKNDLKKNPAGSEPMNNADFYFLYNYPILIYTDFFLPVLIRSTVVIFFKFPEKIRLIVESSPVKYFRNSKIGGGQ